MELVSLLSLKHTKIRLFPMHWQEWALDLLAGPCRKLVKITLLTSLRLDNG